VPGSGQIIFTPVADTYVSRAQPDANFGQDTVLHIDKNPQVRTYLRFNVQGVDRRQVKRVLLRVFVTASQRGFMLHWVRDTGWDEGSLTYSNAPKPRGVLARVWRIKDTGWVALDITRFVRWNGNYSFALTTSSRDEVLIGSSEAGEFSPQLVISTRQGVNNHDNEDEDDD